MTSSFSRSVLGRAVHHDAAALQDVAVVGVAQRHVGVLLGQQEGDLLRWFRSFTISNTSSTICGARPIDGLVEQHHLRVGHQRAADRAHLLLAARGVGGLRRAPRLQAREVGVDLLQRRARSRPCRPCACRRRSAGSPRSSGGRSSAGLPSPGPRRARPGRTVRQLLDALAAQLDRALGHLAALAGAAGCDTARSVVVLPAPLPPSSATMPPSGTCSDTPLSTRITWL